MNVPRVGLKPIRNVVTFPKAGNANKAAREGQKPLTKTHQIPSPKGQDERPTGSGAIPVFVPADPGGEDGKGGVNRG